MSCVFQITCFKNVRNFLAEIPLAQVREEAQFECLGDQAVVNHGLIFMLKNLSMPLINATYSCKSQELSFWHEKVPQLFDATTPSG